MLVVLTLSVNQSFFNVCISSRITNQVRPDIVTSTVSRATYTSHHDLNRQNPISQYPNLVNPRQHLQLKYASSGCNYPSIN